MESSIPSDDQAPILTMCFTRLAVALKAAIVNRSIIGVISPPGVGFKHSLQRFALKHYLRVIVCDVSYSRSINSVLLTLYKELCNVKFSNINYNKVTLHDLTLVLNERLRIGDQCLLCLDHCNLKGAQLKYFIRFLKNFNKPIGLVFRMSTIHANKISKQKSMKEDYAELLKIVSGWRVLESPDELEQRDICVYHGVSERLTINELIAASNNNLSILKRNIDVYLSRQSRPGI